MKIILTEKQYRKLKTTYVITENDDIVYDRFLGQVDLTAKRKFNDPATQTAWDKFKEAEKKFSTMMKSHGSKYNYKFPCSELQSGANATLFNNCTKNVYTEYNRKNAELTKMSPYLDWARSFLPNWKTTYPEVYEYQLMTTPEGLGMMRSAYGSCKSAGNYDCSSFMDYYNKIGKNIDSNVYQLPPDELELLKKQWATLHAVAQAAKSRNPVKVVQSVVKAGVEGTFQTVRQAIDWIKNNIDQFMEGLREYLNGTTGGVINTILELTGIGKAGVAFQYGILTLYDFVKQNWVKFIHDLLGIISGPLASKLFKPFKSFFSKGFSSLDEAVSSISSQPWFKTTVGKVANTLRSGVSSVKSLLTSVSSWVSQNLGIDWLTKSVNTVISYLESLVTKILSFISKEGAQDASKQIVSQAVIDPIKQKAIEKSGLDKEYQKAQDVKSVSKGGTSTVSGALNLAGLN